ncbi:hypothetical protein [Gelidibacter japonicus]
MQTKTVNATIANDFFFWGENFIYKMLFKYIKNINFFKVLSLHF